MRARSPSTEPTRSLSPSLRRLGVQRYLPCPAMGPIQESRRVLPPLLRSEGRRRGGEGQSDRAGARARPRRSAPNWGGAMSQALTIERQYRSPRSSGTGIRPACPRVGDWRRPLRPGLPTSRRDRTPGTEEAPLPFSPSAASRALASLLTARREYAKRQAAARFSWLVPPCSRPGCSRPSRTGSMSTGSFSATSQSPWDCCGQSRRRSILTGYLYGRMCDQSGPQWHLELLLPRLPPAQRTHPGPVGRSFTPKSPQIAGTRVPHPRRIRLASLSGD